MRCILKEHVAILPIGYSQHYYFTVPSHFLNVLMVIACPKELSHN